MTAGTPYSGGDFQTFEAGKTYYMAITTVYKDGSSVTSEPVMVTIPKGTSDSSSRKPAVLKLHQENDGIKLLWQSDVTYYFTVTTVFKDGTKLTSNVVSAKLP